MRIFTLIASGLFTLIGIVFIIKGDYSLVGETIFFGFGLTVFIFQKKLNKWISSRAKKKIEATYCILKDNHILFPKGYYFKHGYLKDKKELSYTIINEIRTNTFPITAKINSNEIIFLIGQKKEDIMLLAEDKNIPISKPIDTWSLIFEEFLDTEFDQHEKEETIKILEENGIKKEETEKIRKKFSFRMLLYTYFTWEWQYYGHYDVLKQIFPLNEEKYWWTMDIALRQSTLI